MSDSKKLLCVMASLALLGFVLNATLGSIKAEASGGGAPVMVVNTPLPVSAAQSGAWAVSVSNTPNVNIANTPSVTLAAGGSVRDADNPARQTPILGEGTTYNAAHQGGCSSTEDGCNKALFQVPTGKRLVIEYASMNACLTAGETATMEISVVSSANCQVGSECGVDRLYYTTMSAPAIATDAATNCPGTGSGTTSVGQSVRIYADAGQVIVVGAHRNKGETGSGGYLFGLSGYMVDTP